MLPQLTSPGGVAIALRATGNGVMGLMLLLQEFLQLEDSGHTSEDVAFSKNVATFSLLNKASLWQLGQPGAAGVYRDQNQVSRGLP